MHVTINTKGVVDMNKFLTSVLLCCFMIGPAVAGTAVDSTVATAWISSLKDGEAWGWCGQNSVATGVMNDVGGERKFRGDIYWIAWELTANGGKFCPTQLGAGRNGGKDAYTTYYNVEGLNNSCIWLCKNGFGGDKCSEKVEPVADEQPIMQTTDKKNADSQNIEDKIAMLIANKGWHKICRDSAHPYHAKNSQEHDVVLAVTEYTPDGYGAFVGPLVVRAASKPVGSYWGDYNRAYAFAYPANNTDTKLVCVNGYKHNAAGNGCVKYSQEQVDREAAQVEAKTAADNACSGWVISTTDEFINTYDIKMVGSCNQYRCKDSSKGFKSEMDKTCVPCGDNSQHGVNPDTGVCVECTTKQTFSADAQYKESGYCRDKLVVIPGALQYGINNTSNDLLGEQCWYKLFKDGFEVYKDCIFGKETDKKNVQVSPQVGKMPQTRFEKWK